jgi:RHS repeat-associated protein
MKSKIHEFRNTILLMSIKKLLYIVALLPMLVKAQSTDQNWVKSITYKDTTKTSIPSPTAAKAVIQVNYYDGLGRPIQQVAHAQSNTGKDIVTHIEYDAFGRMEKEFLPYVNQSAGLNYNANANTDVLTFYDNVAYENTQNPFSQKELEASPLSRVFKQASPGLSWGLPQSTGVSDDRSIKLDYQTNTSIDDVKLFTVTSNWDIFKELYDIPTSLSSSNYNDFQLYQTITKDENWISGKNHTTQEFKNKDGQVVLKRTFNNGDTYDTYYVYDQFGNLTFVIPPAVDTTISIISTVLDNMCYQYKYDYRNRLVEKKLPGKQWEYIVYDKLDRVVATGPAYNPYGATSENDKGWILTKYDVLNRPVYTAWHSAPVSVTADRKVLQGIYNNATTFSESKTTSATTINGIATKYTNQVSPSAFILLTVNYYDNYDYPNAPQMPIFLADSTLPTTVNVKGLSTGTWVRVLDVSGSKTHELSYTIYDTKFRPVRSYTKNYLGGYTLVDSKLDWAGKTEYTITKHNRALNGFEVITKDSFEYSNQDRLTKHYHQIGSQAEQLISLNTYDELGQLTSKKVGGEDITGANAFQNVDYSYNIRGWLKSINDVANLGTDLFAFRLNYNDHTNLGLSDVAPTPLFNGNIAGTYWIGANDNVLRKYNYEYDHLNRLAYADYLKPNVSTSMNNYKEWLGYDKNGNINDIVRSGNIDPDSGSVENIIDELHFTYDADNKNLLVKVDDTSNSPQGFKDNYASSGDDYKYDANGNITKDNNKNIESIRYNHLNLPTYIRFLGTTNGTISYIYNAIGQKVKKIVDEGSPINTEYFGGFQYEDAILQFFPHAEGYVKASASVGRNGQVEYYYYNYVFNYTDHLGNIRMSYAFDPNTVGLKILEENHYYPFGLKHQNYNVEKLDFETFPETGIEIVPTDNTMYKYKYNGKELQEELGLNMYDYGARNYDPAIGRWMNIDPLAETSRRWSPYTYCYNNPLRFTDPDGMQADDVIIKGDLSKKAFKQLQSSTSLKLERNKETGKLSASGEAKTKADTELLKAINDECVTVKIDATSANYVSSDKLLIGGAFMGSTVNAETGVVTANQKINPNQTEKIESLAGNGTGVIAMHETLEAYSGALQSPGAKSTDTEAFDKAHATADALDPRRANDKSDITKEITNVSTYNSTGDIKIFVTNGVKEKKLFQVDSFPIQIKK